MAEQGTSLVMASFRHQRVRARRGRQVGAGEGHGGQDQGRASARDERKGYLARNHRAEKFTVIPRPRSSKCGCPTTALIELMQTYDQRG